MALPLIIQGGMGVGISDWRLARTVARAGQLGVVAGTALDRVLTRRLQSGDPGGHVRRALASFPLPEVARRILERDFVEGGKARTERFKEKALGSVELSRELTERIVAGNFVEVFLAREGHDGLVGVNYLEKIQLPTLPSLFGAMLAGVHYVLMGAGIPTAIPGILDRLARGEAVELSIDVQGEREGFHAKTHFDPADFCGGEAPPLERPRFLGIVSSHTIAARLVRGADGAVDGFVVEGPTAGGHNAPPRSHGELTATGEPVYGARDEADLDKLAALELPFWLAGSYAGPDRLREARARGATGVQIGTAFAYCAESGLPEKYKREVLAQSREHAVRIFTDPKASPTGFPFKVVQLDETMSNDALNAARERVCDLGYLRTAYRREDGKLGWRCPGEPVADYVAKGGDIADTVGRKCLCNGLMATIELAQVQRDGRPELPLVTSGLDARQVSRFLREGAESYSANDVIEHVLA
ncbi:MAG: nitronate monooxygenase [Planctomycetes bacterium]|nr:nitronate monooxygenase [Planctomycetota bacterium]MCB9902774.1 nitronate monooxygenase [Planctomycetota bacterium]